VVVDKRKVGMGVGKKIGFGNFFDIENNLAEFEMSAQVLIEGADLVEKKSEAEDD